MMKLINTLKFSLLTPSKRNTALSNPDLKENIQIYYDFTHFSCQFVRFYGSTTDDGGRRRGDIPCQKLQLILLRRKPTDTYRAKDGPFCSFAKELYSSRVSWTVTEMLTVMSLYTA